MWDANWCLLSDGMTNSRLQAAPAKKGVVAAASTPAPEAAPEAAVAVAPADLPLRWKTPPAAYMTYDDDVVLGKQAPGLDSLECVQATVAP